MYPVARIKRGIGRRLGPARDAQQRSEGIERVETPIEAEGELVEVGLQVLGADAVMGAVEPGFQVREDQVDNRHELFSDLGIAAFGNGVMIVAELSEAAITAPVVADDQCARCNGALDEPTQRVGTTVGHDGQSDPPGVTTILALILRGAGFAVADFDGGGHKRFMMDTAPFSARLAADPGFIDLHMVRRLPTNSVLVGSHHASTKLVKNSKCSFVACQAKLPLKLDGRYAGGLSGNKICSPEPRPQRRVAAFHNRSDCQSVFAAALAADQHPWPRGNTKRFTNFQATRARKPVDPASPLQIAGARIVIGKEPLKFRERLRERQIVDVENIHNSSLPTLGALYP